jgi:LEA14-like dessication related protein
MTGDGPPHRRERSLGPTVTAIAGLAVTIGAVGACASGLQPPSVDIVRVRVGALGLTAGEARVSLRVANPNTRGIRLHNVDYAVDVASSADAGSWVLLGEGVTEAGIVLPPEDTVEIEIDLPFNYTAVGAALRSLFLRGEVDYRVRGLVRTDGPLGNVHVPFESSGRLAPFGSPEPAIPRAGGPGRGGG